MTPLGLGGAAGLPPVDGSFAKAMFDSVEQALATIPDQHTHAVLFDGTYSAADGPGIHAQYLQKTPGGWTLVLDGGYDGPHGALGQVELAKSW